MRIQAGQSRPEIWGPVNGSKIICALWPCTGAGLVGMR